MDRLARRASVAAAISENRRSRSCRRRSSSGAADMAGRRQSMSAQLSRTARRFSAAIAPQFTKIDQLQVLQKHRRMEIRICNVKQLQTAVEQYVMRNAVQFQPIEFEILDESGCRVLQATLFPDELVLVEGARRILSIGIADDEDSSSCVAKIHHPVSGIKVYELIELGGSIQIQSATDELNGCRIDSATGAFSQMMKSCGCVFTAERWAVAKEDVRVAYITPVKSFFNENSIKVEWTELCENEIRLLALSFGLVQMVREAFPSLMHIIKEFHTRRG